MIDINKFENRIVKFKRITEGREDTVKEAEIRRIVYDQLAGMPRSITARFVEPLNAIMTLKYDQTHEKFRGPLGPDILESDFDTMLSITFCSSNGPLILSILDGFFLKYSSICFSCPGY